MLCFPGCGFSARLRKVFQEYMMKGLFLFARPRFAQGTLLFHFVLVVLRASVASGLEKLPTITTQPESVTGAAGGEAVLFARAYGIGELSFQWLRNEVPLPQADKPVLRLTALTAEDEGDYRIVISNQYGSSTSAVARITLGAAKEGGLSPAAVVCYAIGYVNKPMVPGLTLVVNPL